MHADNTTRRPPESSHSCLLPAQRRCCAPARKRLRKHCRVSLLSLAWLARSWLLWLQCV